MTQLSLGLGDFIDDLEDYPIGACSCFIVVNFTDNKWAASIPRV